MALGGEGAGERKNDGRVEGGGDGESVIGHIGQMVI